VTAQSVPQDGLSTNLMEGLGPAALRCFGLKIRFD
jgi:hypothetical protein